MCWSPADGYVPRGVCGATGDLSEVELVLVSAEPGDPLPGEVHDGNGIASTAVFSVQCLRCPPTPFHGNVRHIMDLCFPGCSFDDQLRKVWRTNSVLCSAKMECGSIPGDVERTCIAEYLTKQLALVPHAVVAALGAKAQRRLRQAGISAFPALHPSCRESNEAKQASWQALAERVRKKRGQVHSNSRNAPQSSDNTTGVEMPGSKAPLSDQPDRVLEELQREGQENMELMRDIVTHVCQLGRCHVADANWTRALAVNAIDITGRRTPQFFAILTEQHKGFHRTVGPRGFSIQVAFRKDAGVQPTGSDWVCDRFDYKKGNQVWWRNDLSQGGVVDVESVVGDVARARVTFLSE